MSLKVKLLRYRVRCSRRTVVLLSVTGDGCCRRKLSTVNRFSASGTFVYKIFTSIVARMEVPETIPVQLNCQLCYGNV